MPEHIGDQDHTEGSKQRSVLARIFISANEPRLRLIWRLLLLSLITSILIIPPTLLALIATLFIPFPPNLTMLITAIIPSGMATMAAIVINRLVFDQRMVSSLGLRWQPETTKDLLAGFGIAGLMMALVLLTEFAFGWLKFEGLSPLSMKSAISLLMWVLGILVVGFYEEMLFRGYLYQNFNEHLNTPATVFLTSFLFSIGHLLNPNASIASIVGIFIAGIYLAYGYLRTRQLWLSIGLHIGWNFFLGPVFGFPVSGLHTFTFIQQSVSGPPLITGGDFGPEAGWVLLPGLVVGTLLIHMYSRDRGKEQLTHEQ